MKTKVWQIISRVKPTITSFTQMYVQKLYLCGIKETMEMYTGTKIAFHIIARGFELLKTTYTVSLDV